MPEQRRSPYRIALLLVAVAIAAAGGWYWYTVNQDNLPPGFAAGNGRIEAEQVDIATKLSGRVEQILAAEGDLVEAGQIMARMDVAELNASHDKAKADVAQAEQSVLEAEAGIAQRESELAYARQELQRALVLVERGHISEQLADLRRTQRATAQAALRAAEAQRTTAQRLVEARQAEVARIQTQIDDATLIAPIAGRVLYRLTEPGEVIGAGGKILTLLNLSDVYMTVFLPAGEAARLPIGAEGRITIDAAPELVIPGRVSFVSPEAQFTPKQVETREEREKLMFRVKVRIPPDLLSRYIARVKTGIRGVAYVRVDDAADWPAHLALNLPDSDR